MSCGTGDGVCVSVVEGLIVTGDSKDMTLHMFALSDGSAVRVVGGLGDGEGRFNWNRGGLCVSPDGHDVLVAESDNRRLQQVRIADGAHVRFLGRGGPLRCPEYVDCNADVVAVSNGQPAHTVTLLAWDTGVVRAQLGGMGTGDGQLLFPHGVRVLRDGAHVVVADTDNHRLSVFDVDGAFVRTMHAGVSAPHDVVEVDGGFLVVNWGFHDVVKLSTRGWLQGRCGRKGLAHGEFTRPSGVALLPGGGVVVREWGACRFQVFGE